MDTSRRILFLLVSLVIVATACSGDGDETVTTTTAATTTEAPTTTTQAPGTTASGGASGGAGETTTTTAATTTTEAEPNVVTIAVDLTDGTVTGGGRRSITEGTIVQLVVTADIEDRVIVEGYDLEADVSPSSAAIFDFAAESTGTHTVELEDSGIELLELEIVP